MIDVSIVIPAYNRLWCLPRAVKSCLNTQCRTEIIVVDDGSTDGTWDWLESQPDLIKVKQFNQGQTYAVNKGTLLARGKYIRFLDSDDFLEAGIIDQQFTAAEQSGAELVYSRVDNYVERTKEKIQRPDLGEVADFMELQLSKRYGSHFLGMLFRTDWVAKVPRRPDYAMREDRMFLLEYLLLEPRIAYVPGCAGYWVNHDDQMQGNYNGLKAQVTNWQHLNIFKVILGRLSEQGKLTQARKNAAIEVLWVLAHWIAKDYPKEALGVVAWIKELNPSFVVPDKGLMGLLFKTLGFKQAQRILRLRRSLLLR
ncbi:MAG: glycosyltransferase family 2 protein [Pedobacter sp.]|nr:glycosyltransferase family 2 protein [Pedobacter sp.]MDQ8053946.1 glycosyltransferase family 2 protein [Pedobacter sp.]